MLILHVERGIMTILGAICILSLCVIDNGRPTTMMIHYVHEAGNRQKAAQSQCSMVFAPGISSVYHPTEVLR